MSKHGAITKCMHNMYTCTCNTKVNCLLHTALSDIDIHATRQTPRPPFSVLTTPNVLHPALDREPRAPRADTVALASRRVSPRANKGQSRAGSSWHSMLQSKIRRTPHHLINQAVVCVSRLAGGERKGGISNRQPLGGDPRCAPGSPRCGPVGAPTSSLSRSDLAARAT